ncbi:MAG: recombination mediator RecR [Bacteroidota bacterium]|nr:recombination mediator RecR [Bacteroidota bacterium]
MEYSSQIIKNLVDSFVRFPGIGKRTAIRMVLHLLKQNDDEVTTLGELILKTRTEIKYCKICHNLSDKEVCNICSDNSRDHSSVCVVEDLRDIIAIENTSQFNGVYHVLGGLISPIEGVSPSELNINSLIKRIEKDEIKELIFALNANMEGDTTMFYISKQLKNKKIKLSAISRGISVGGELEFADEITLGRSIKNRTTYHI